MCAMRLTGYADKFGVHPGDKIKFYVNCDGPTNREVYSAFFDGYNKTSGQPPV